MKLGIYEQIINQLFEEKISSIDQSRFFVGERVIKKDEVAKLLSMYLTSIFEQVLSDVVECKQLQIRKGLMWQSFEGARLLNNVYFLDCSHNSHKFVVTLRAKELTQWQEQI